MTVKWTDDDKALTLACMTGHSRLSEWTTEIASLMKRLETVSEDQKLYAVDFDGVMVCTSNPDGVLILSNRRDELLGLRAEYKKASAQLQDCQSLVAQHVTELKRQNDIILRMCDDTRELQAELHNLKAKTSHVLHMDDDHAIHGDLDSIRMAKVKLAERGPMIRENVILNQALDLAMQAMSDDGRRDTTTWNTQYWLDRAAEQLEGTKP